MSERRIALILEDEPIIAFTLEDMLLDLGYDEVELASTLADARRFLENRSPDVAILDVNIHGERSYGLAGELTRQSVPFVFATGYGDAEHPEGLKDVATLTKPYSLAELRAVLEAALG